MDEALAEAAALIAQADALVVAAGAGMGVDSGLPDFRGGAGFWKAYPALAQSGIRFHEIANPQSFARSPELAWGFYGHRLKLYRETVPHEGFAILRRWADTKLHHATVFTSNVDGHFARTGFAASLHECHGSLMHLQCTEDCDGIWPADDFLPEVDEVHCRLVNALPRCPHCGALARPNVLMFSDWGWQPQRTQRQAVAQSAWLRGAQRIVVVEMGAGTAIPSVRHFSERLALEHGARLVRINPREPAVPTRHDLGLPLPALAALQALDRLMQTG